jgi:hypothetical protein
VTAAGRGTILPFEERLLEESLAPGPAWLRRLVSRWRTRGLYRVPRPYRVRG